MRFLAALLITLFITSSAFAGSGGRIFEDANNNGIIDGGDVDHTATFHAQGTVAVTGSFLIAGALTSRHEQGVQLTASGGITFLPRAALTVLNGIQTTSAAFTTGDGVSISNRNGDVFLFALLYTIGPRARFSSGGVLDFDLPGGSASFADGCSMKAASIRFNDGGVVMRNCRLSAKNDIRLNATFGGVDVLGTTLQAGGAIDVNALNDSLSMDACRLSARGDIFLNSHGGSINVRHSSVQAASLDIHALGDDESSVGFTDDRAKIARGGSVNIFGTAVDLTGTSFGNLPADRITVITSGP